MSKMPERGEVIRDEAALRALYEELHLRGPFPDFESDRFRRAAALYERATDRLRRTACFDRRYESET